MIPNLPLTIEETRKALRKKELTVSEIVDSYFQRIDKENKELNVYLTLNKERAYKIAKEQDRLIKDKKDEAFIDKPLLGITVAHKDLFLTKNLRTTAGSKVLENFYPVYSATLVRRLDLAGSINLGKTNLDAWAHGASGENSDFGPTLNPWNKDYVAGGSSSGSAAAVASNLALFATGTDTGGSIRLPANFCGVVGLKPTYGALSRYGVIAMASSLDTVGFFGRVVKDIRLIFDLTKGKDGKDSNVSESFYIKKRPRTIGVPKEYFLEGIEREVSDSVLGAIEVFKKNGFKIKEISLPHTKYAISVYYIIQPAEVSSNLSRYDGIRFGKGRIYFGSEAKRRIILGTFVLSSGYIDKYYIQALKVRKKIIEDFDKAFEEVDLIISPVSPTCAFLLGERVDDPLKMYLSDILTVPANLAGIPGLALPYGFNRKGLPLGFQILGPRFSEYMLFEAGEFFQKITSYSPSVPF